MTRNKMDYSVLALLSGAFIIYFLANQNNHSLLFSATLTFSCLYVIWGIAHHLREHSFNLKIMLEYLLVAILGVIVASTLLL